VELTPRSRETGTVFPTMLIRALACFSPQGSIHSSFQR
jgi:hypothetical protein